MGKTNSVYYQDEGRLKKKNQIPKLVHIPPRDWNINLVTGDLHDWEVAARYLNVAELRFSATEHYCRSARHNHLHPVLYYTCLPSWFLRQEATDTTIKNVTI